MGGGELTHARPREVAERILRPAARRSRAGSHSRGTVRALRAAAGRGVSASRRGPEAGRPRRTRLLDRRCGQTAHRVRGQARARRASSAASARVVRLSPSPVRLSAARRSRGGARLLCRARRRSPGGHAGAAQRCAVGPHLWFGRTQGTRVVAGLAHLRVHPHLGSQAASFPRRTLRLRSRQSHSPLRYLPRRGRHLDQSVRGSSQPAAGPPAYCKRTSHCPSSTTLSTLPILLGTRDRRSWAILRAVRALRWCILKGAATEWVVELCARQPFLIQSLCATASSRVSHGREGGRSPWTMSRPAPGR